MSTRRFERLTLVFLVAFAFLLRVWDLGRNSLWYDEILQAEVAGGRLENFVPALILHAAMPLDYLIERGVLLLGTNEFLLRFPAATFSTLAVAVLYKVGRAMFGRVTGIVAAGFLAVSSFAVFYAHEARPYALYLLLTLASFSWLYRALQTNRLTHWLLFGVCIGGAVLTHLFTLFVVIPQVLFVAAGLAVRGLAPRRALLFARVTRSTIAGSVLVALVFLGALWLTPNAQFVWGASLKFLAFLLSPQFLSPDKWYGLAPGETPPLLGLDFLYSRILENFSGGGILATGMFVATGLIGLTAFRHKPWEIILLLVWALVPAALIVLFLGSRGTLFAARYLIAGLPAWLLLCAVGILGLGSFLGERARNPAFVRRAAWIFLALVFILIFLERTNAVIAAPKENWRAAAQVIDANIQPSDAVITSGGTWVVYYYAYADAYRNNAQTLEQIEEVEKSAARMWLVFNRYAYDPEGRMHAWLEGRRAVALRVDDGITVYYWRPGADAAAMLADAKTLRLPPNSAVYRSLGDQFARNGDLHTAQQYFAKALEYAESQP